MFKFSPFARSHLLPDGEISSMGMPIFAVMVNPFGPADVTSRADASYVTG